MPYLGEAAGGGPAIGSGSHNYNPYLGTAPVAPVSPMVVGAIMLAVYFLVLRRR